MSTCKKIPNCPKGISRKDLIKVAELCGVPGWDNEYKSPYRNMAWLCREIDNIVEGQPKKESEIETEVETEVETKTKAVKRPQTKPEPSKEDEIMKNYQEYWTKEYGIDRTKPEMHQLGRERYLRHHGGPAGLQKIRKQEFTEKMSKKIPERAAEKVQEEVRKEILCTPCYNLSPEEQQQMDPLQLIRFRIQKDGQTHCLCYDVQLLYEQLKETYGASRDSDFAQWTDPVLDVLYSSDQVKRIKRAWSKSRPGSAARVHLETAISLSKAK